MRTLLVLLLCLIAPMALAADAPIDLAGSEWGFAGESGPDERFVQFGEAGVVSGTGGCNRFSGHYATKGEALTITGLVTTLMACQDETIMQREGELYGVLEAVRRIEATHLALKLLGEDGALLAELVRRDFD